MHTEHPQIHHAMIPQLFALISLCERRLTENREEATSATTIEVPASPGGRLSSFCNQFVLQTEPRP